MDTEVIHGHTVFIQTGHRQSSKQVIDNHPNRS